MILSKVTERLLTANKLTQQDVMNSLERLSTRKIDYGDIYFQTSYYESWSLEDNIIKNASFNIDQCAGIRAISGEKTGFAYTDQISLSGLERSTTAARSISAEEQKSYIAPLSAKQIIPIYSNINPLVTFSQEEKIALLQRINQLARSLDPRVSEVRASISGSYDEVLILDHWFVCLSLC